jgi:hypothetical protein
MLSIIATCRLTTKMRNHFFSQPEGQFFAAAKVAFVPE